MVSSATVILKHVSHPLLPPSFNYPEPSPFINFRSTFLEAMEFKTETTKSRAIQVLTQLASSSNRKALFCKYVIVPLLFIAGLGCTVGFGLGSLLIPSIASTALRIIIAVIHCFLPIPAILLLGIGIFSVLPRCNIFHHLSEGYTQQARAACSAIQEIEEREVSPFCIEIPPQTITVRERIL